MSQFNDLSPCDTCDRRTAKANSQKPLSDSQRRFLDAYREKRLLTAPAARMAGVHRATVYRWIAADAGFQAAREAAIELYYREHQAKVRADEATRRMWREERERGRRSMRCENLARARVAKRR